MLVNIAKAGFFSSDRTIEQYNNDIWHLTPAKYSNKICDHINSVKNKQQALYIRWNIQMSAVLCLSDHKNLPLC